MTINEAITIYLEESAKAAEAKKKADAAKKFILAAAGNLDELTTDSWVVYIRRTLSERLDTSALYHDFPDIKETYGKTTVSTSLDAHARTAANKRSA